MEKSIDNVLFDGAIIAEDGIYDTNKIHRIVGTVSLDGLDLVVIEKEVMGVDDDEDARIEPTGNMPPSGACS